MTNSGEAVELDLFPSGYGGSTPTSPLQFKIVEIDKRIAASIYREHHYFSEKDFLNSYSFGAMYDGVIWAAISYGIPNAKNIKGLYKKNEQHGVLEIVRLAGHPKCPKNTPSRLIRISLILLRKKYPLRIVITYADTAQNHEGGIYKASGFNYYGLTAQKTDFIKTGENAPKKLKGVKYSELDGKWVPRSRKHLFYKKFPNSY